MRKGVETKVRELEGGKDYEESLSSSESRQNPKADCLDNQKSVIILIRMTNVQNATFSLS